MMRGRWGLWWLLALCCACSDGTGTRASGSRGTAGSGARGSSGRDGSGNRPGAQTDPTPGPRSNICEAVHVNASPQTPDMLIVLDRSGSMAEGGRWDPSVSAVRLVTMQLQSAIRFGLAMFPNPTIDPAATALDITQCLSAGDIAACVQRLTGDGGVLAESCAPGDIIVPIAIDNAAAIGQALDMTQPLGSTPTPGTLQGLLDTFAARSIAPDTAVNAKYILLVTDGQPTCPAGGGALTTQPDIDASNSAIDALTALGVRTYVIGYDTTGTGNEALAAVLDGFAQRGGTGDKQHRPVEDEQSLLLELQRIAGAIVGCSFVLEQPPPRAEVVLVRLDGIQVNLGASDGWSLLGDRTVELAGAACEKLRDGGAHAVDVEVQCQDVIPQ